MCMKVCVLFLCSIMRYDITDDIEAIILTESYKVWKMDYSKLFGTYIGKLQPNLVNPNYVIKGGEVGWGLTL
jgi:hypothetical protein